MINKRLTECNTYATVPKGKSHKVQHDQHHNQHNTMERNSYFIISDKSRFVACWSALTHTLYRPLMGVLAALIMARPLLAMDASPSYAR
jgi:hypothetical protein